VESSWKKDGMGFELTVRIPANASATVYLPARTQEQITETGRPVSQAAGVHYLRQEGTASVFEVASGQYTFQAPKP
jgi:alpha-L-rhamnosidase